MTKVTPAANVGLNITSATLRGLAILAAAAAATVAAAAPAAAQSVAAPGTGVSATGAPVAGGAAARQNAAIATGVPIEILSVKPSPVRLAGALSRTPTQRFEVNFRVLPARAGEAPLSANPDWADKIKFTLTLGYEITAPKTAPRAGTRAGAAGQAPAATVANKIDNYHFYRSSATVLTLRRGTTASVFFYLPGEIIERDLLASNGGDPTGAVAEVEIAGKAGTPWFSRKLKGSKEQQEGFAKLASEGVLDTAGILRNQNQIQGLDIRFPAAPSLVAEDAR
ncbi:MAG: hypothetical protein LBT53_04345 [Puniceicoccales bacterium]|jgi:hypothetical protein|nr:hypothetical protein [Puniceicoccales bacterium]